MSTVHEGICPTRGADVIGPSRSVVSSELLLKRLRPTDREMQERPVAACCVRPPVAWIKPGPLSAHLCDGIVELLTVERNKAGRARVRNFVFPGAASSSRDVVVDIARGVEAISEQPTRDTTEYRGCANFQQFLVWTGLVLVVKGVCLENTYTYTTMMKRVNGFKGASVGMTLVTVWGRHRANHDDQQRWKNMRLKEFTRDQETTMMMKKAFPPKMVSLTLLLLLRELLLDNLFRENPPGRRRKHVGVLGTLVVP